MTRSDASLMEENGLLVGPVRIALNSYDSSVHNPETAARLGFRGEIVIGTSHMNLFVPMLLDAYGNEWFESGCLSLYFLDGVVSGEPVQAVVRKASTGTGQIETWARRADKPEIRVARGTASLGDHSRSELRTRDLRLSDPSELRMLRDVEVGTFLRDEVRTLPFEEQAEGIRSGAISETLPWYTGESPWGGPIACPMLAARLFQSGAADRRRVSPAIGAGSGIFGATELAYVEGPILLDRPYRIKAQIVGVGQSPRTENYWWDATAEDQEGRVIATLRQLARLFKIDSPLYPELSS